MTLIIYIFTILVLASVLSVVKSDRRWVNRNQLHAVRRAYREVLRVWHYENALANGSDPWTHTR